MTLPERLFWLHRAHRSATERDEVDDARMYRNLLHLLPHCAPMVPPVTPAYSRPSQGREGPT